VAERRPLHVIRIQQRGDGVVDLARRRNNQVQASAQFKDRARMCLRRHVRKNVFDARVRSLTAHEQQNNARCLHASGELEQASRTEQGCKDDDFKRRH